MVRPTSGFKRFYLSHANKSTVKLKQINSLESCIGSHHTLCLWILLTGQRHDQDIVLQLGRRALPALVGGEHPDPVHLHGAEPLHRVGGQDGGRDVAAGPLGALGGPDLHVVAPGLVQEPRHGLRLGPGQRQVCVRPVRHLQVRDLTRRLWGDGSDMDASIVSVDVSEL